MNFLDTLLNFFRMRQDVKEKELLIKSKQRKLDYARQGLENDFERRDNQLVAGWRSQRLNFDTESEWHKGLEDARGSLQEERNYELGKIDVDSDLLEDMQTEQKTSSVGLTWLRWIAVLPGALIAGLLSTFPLHWILYLAFAHDGTLLGLIELPPGANLPIERALYPFVIAITYIWAGSKIAPAYKFGTAVGLAILYVVFAVGALIFGANSGLQFSIEIRSVGPILGLILGLLLVRQEVRQASGN